MQLEIVLWCVGTALAVGVIVFALMAQGRRSLQLQVAAAQSAQAVAESRFADIAATHVTEVEKARRLGEEQKTLIAERERLRTSLESTDQNLQRVVTDTADLRSKLEEKTRLHSQLEGDYRAAVTERGNLTQRVTEVEGKARQAEDVNRQQSDAIAKLTGTARALEAERNGLNDRLAAQETWFREQTRLFEEKIVNVTNQMLEDKSQKFTEVNRREMDALVTPFKEQLGEFRQRVDSIYAADSKDRGQLQEQVAQLARLNQTVSQKAEDLTRALTISSKSTGDWGEMILEKILEDSGLRADKEYTLQHTVEANDETLQRPDAVIFLPEGRQLVIDAKVSNKAWTEYCSAPDDDARAARLDEHLASIRAHIRGLSARDYPNSPDLQTVDFVLMFVPVEAALLTALARDESLYMEAYRKKIVLVTASTLMAVIKLVEGTWAFQKRKESADKIAEAGRKLYEKLTVFSNTFIEIGEAIEKAHGTFEKARGQLATGKGNTVRLAQKMVELGVTPAAGKVMPPELVELAGEEDDEALPALEAPVVSETGEVKENQDEV